MATLRWQMTAPKSLLAGPTAAIISSISWGPPPRQPKNSTRKKIEVREKKVRAGKKGEAKKSTRKKTITRKEKIHAKKVDAKKRKRAKTEDAKKKKYTRIKVRAKK